MSIKFLNGIDVDNGVLYTDTSNNRVGINTSSPQVPLEVKYTGTADEIVRIVGTASGKPQVNFYNDTTLHTKIVAAGNNDFSITNTHSTGDMFFAAGGSTRLHIESNGNVGIGTASPQSKLHIETGSGGTYNPNTNHDDVTIEGSGNIGLQLFSPNTSYQYIAFGDPNSVNAGYLRYYHGANEMVFRTNGSDNMVINSSGNVGIGTTSPSAKLEVNGQTVINSTGLTEGFQWFNDTNEIFSLEDTSGAGELLLLSSNSVKVKLNANGNSYFNGGNVGIGTSNPGVKLHIGPGTASSSTVEEFRIQTGTSSGYGGTAIINLLTGQYGNSGIYFGDQATYSSQPAFIEFQDSPSTLIYKAPVTSGSHVFKIGTSEQVRIAYNGYVGIGMSNPGAKLHVGVSSGSSSTTQEFRLQTQSGGYGGEAIINLRTGQYGTSGVYFGDGLSHTAQPAYIKFIDSSNSFGLKTTGSFSFQVNSSIGMYLNAVGLGVGTTSPGEKLEVNGSVKATASTDAYKGYIKQNVISYAAEKQENANYYFTSYNTTATVTSAQAYNRTVAAYSGRVKKVYIRHGGGLTPTATAVNFKKHTNGTTSSTIYSATVANSAGANMSAYYEFGNNDFTFSAGDLIGLLYQTTDAFGTASKTMGQVAVTITLEYNIT